MEQEFAKGRGCFCAIGEAERKAALLSTQQAPQEELLTRGVALDGVADELEDVPADEAHTRRYELMHDQQDGRSHKAGRYPHRMQYKTHRVTVS
jgi:hypothetical protein